MVDEMFDRDTQQKIGKQIVLPMRRAIEISLQSMKVRFWRSMITVSSIILAIAFLSFVLINTAILRALKGGPAAVVDVLEIQVDALKEDLGVEPAGELETLTLKLRSVLRPFKDGPERAAEDLNAKMEVLRQKLGAEGAEKLETFTLELAALKQASEEEIEELKAKVEALKQELGSRAAGELEALTLELAALKDGPVKAAKDLEAKVETLKQELGAERGNELQTLVIELAEETALRDRIEVVLRGEGAGDEDKGAMFEPAKKKTGFLAEFKAKDYWLITLALVVCFVGIVNAMLMSVTERFREIGTMKCLGALDSFIVKLFVLESVFQGALGTFIGISLGALLAVLRAWSSYGNVTFRFFPWLGFLACVGVAQGIGTFLTVVAATFPARAAARMQPVDALRADQ